MANSARKRTAVFTAPLDVLRGKRITVLRRCQDVRLELMDFAEFYATSRASCLRAVLVVTGDPAAAEDFVAEAFARAWASWRTVGRHPAP